MHQWSAGEEIEIISPRIDRFFFLDRVLEEVIITPALIYCGRITRNLMSLVFLRMIIRFS